MKKFEITSIKACDVANLSSVNVRTGGTNIIIEGQNGAGKSTIAKTILWALNGSTADGEKLIPIGSNGLPYAEVELSDGTMFTKFRKELIQKISGGKISRTTDCFMNGCPVTQSSFQEFFNQYVPAEIFNVLIGLGNFFKLKPAEQRKILTEHFGNVTDAEVIMCNAELGTLNLDGKTADEYAVALKKKMTQIKRQMAGIPKAIDELALQAVEVKDDRGTVKVEVLALETELHEVVRTITLAEELHGDFKELQKQAGQATQEYWQRRKEYDALKDEITGLERELVKLREQYETPADTCPTCGQSVHVEHFEKIREKIARDGKAIAAKIEKDKTKLNAILEFGRMARQNMDNLNKKMSLQDFDSTEYEAAKLQRDKLQSEIVKRQKYITQVEMQLELNKKNETRIEELKAQEKSSGKSLAECEYQLALVEKLTQKKMNLITDKINEKFQFVKFKMFEDLKSGDVKTTCTATLDGVPYENLSKGEKLKAALDVLNAFQNYYRVMLPLIIDDAESYTSNSLVEVANQKIMLKAVEGAELKISCGNAERRLSA